MGTIIWAYTLIMLALNAAGQIDVSWWVVFAPLACVAGIWFVILCVIAWAGR